MNIKNIKGKQVKKKGQNIQKRREKKQNTLKSIKLNPDFIVIGQWYLVLKEQKIKTKPKVAKIYKTYHPPVWHTILSTSPKNTTLFSVLPQKEDWRVRVIIFIRKALFGICNYR